MLASQSCGWRGFFFLISKGGVWNGGGWNRQISGPAIWRFITADFPQSEIAATNFYDSGGRIGRRILGDFFFFLGDFFFLRILVLHLLCRMTDKSSPKIPPNLSLHVLWLNFKISSPRASGAWGPQRFRARHFQWNPLCCWLEGNFRLQNSDPEMWQIHTPSFHAPPFPCLLLSEICQEPQLPAEMIAMAFTACGGWQFYSKMRRGNWTSSRWLHVWVWWQKEERKHAETQIERVERKLC